MQNKNLQRSVGCYGSRVCIDDRNNGCNPPDGESIFARVSAFRKTEYCGQAEWIEIKVLVGQRPVRAPGESSLFRRAGIGKAFKMYQATQEVELLCKTLATPSQNSILAFMASCAAFSDSFSFFASPSHNSFSICNDSGA